MLTVVAAVVIQARHWLFCVLGIGMAVGFAAKGFPTMSWIMLMLATGSVAEDLWDQEREAS
ncbi:MAG: hypothetical protein VB141_09840 [Burkholderia gladioli]